MRYILMAILAFSLSACALPFRDVMRHYDDAPICCTSFKEFDYEKLALPASIKFKIDQHSTASSFSTGKSFFKAFELPEYSSPYNINIRSFMIDDAVKTGYIFSPAIIFLNENYIPIRRVEEATFHYIETTHSETWRPSRKLEGTLHITKERRAVRYMIILTTSKLLGATDEYPPLIHLPLIYPEEKILVTHSPTGRLKIDLYRGKEEK